jgi:hypothetical protein
VLASVLALVLRVLLKRFQFRGNVRVAGDTVPRAGRLEIEPASPHARDSWAAEVAASFDGRVAAVRSSRNGAATIEVNGRVVYRERKR